MTLADRLTSWFTRPSRRHRIELAVRRIETALMFQGLTLNVLKRQGDDMATDLSAVEAATARIETAVNRAAAELRDLAGKLLAPDGTEQVAVVAGKLNAAADALNAVVSAVDTDNSSPAVEA